MCAILIPQVYPIKQDPSVIDMTALRKHARLHTQQWNNFIKQIQEGFRPTNDTISPSLQWQELERHIHNETVKAWPRIPRKDPTDCKQESLATNKHHWWQESVKIRQHQSKASPVCA